MGEGVWSPGRRQFMEAAVYGPFFTQRNADGIKMNVLKDMRETCEEISKLLIEYR